VNPASAPTSGQGDADAASSATIAAATPRRAQPRSLTRPATP
jgi:hypothetical protein